jgi:hypothetical protein
MDGIIFFFSQKANGQKVEGVQGEEIFCPRVLESRRPRVSVEPSRKTLFSF